MYSYIPIIDVDLIDFSKLSINNKKILYESSELYIKLSSIKIILSYNKDSIQLCSNLLFKLRIFIDDLYKKILSDEDFLKLRTRPQTNEETNKVVINFIDGSSSSRLIPSKASKYEIVKIRQKDDFFDTIQRFYPYINTTNPQYDVVGDFILKVFFSKNNNFCSFLIFDSDISYLNNKQRTHIYENTIYDKNFVNKIINSIEI